MTHIGGLLDKMTGSVLLTAGEVKEVEGHIDQLCAEAERYKAEYAMLCDGYGSMSREHSQTIIELSDAYEKIDQLQAENAKLREELELWHRLTAGIELPEYPMTQFQPCEHFEPKVVDE